MLTAWPSASGPTVRSRWRCRWNCVTDGAACAVMPVPVCQVTVWPPLERRCERESLHGPGDVAPAASESRGVSEASTGGVPPVKCACRLEPLVSEAVTWTRAVHGGHVHGGAAVAGGCHRADRLTAGQRAVPLVTV